MNFRNPYQDRYDEVRKKNSRKPIIPLKYKFKHKGIPDEIVVDKDTQKLYVVSDNYELLPLGGNSISVMENKVSITADTTSVDTGLEITEGDILLVFQNGMKITEGLTYNIDGNSIVKINGVWNGDLEEIIFTFILINSDYTPNIPDNPSDEDIILPTDGSNGQILIKTTNGMAWADVDISQEQYETIIANTLGTDYLVSETNNNSTNKSINVPSSFPQNGITGQALVRTSTGMAWADVDITEIQYEEIVNNTLGSSYIVDIESLQNALSNINNLISKSIPEGLPQNGTSGQVLYKTDAGSEWKDVDLTDTAYRTIISNTLGDNYIK